MKSQVIGTLREKLLVFVELEEMAASAIADQMLSKCYQFGLKVVKLLMQEYDDLSAMAGRKVGFRSLYPIEAFVLVVNGINSVAQVRIRIGTIKVVIKIVRNSTKCWSLVPNAPLYCDTR